MEEVEMEFDLQKHICLILVEDQIYFRVKQQAKIEQRSLEEMVTILLERELA
jgi:hypothetical protein